MVRVRSSSQDNKLFEDAESVKAKMAEQSVEVEKLKQENVQLQVKADSGGGVSSKAVDQRLLKLQEELTEMHRKKGENSQKIIDLNNAIQEKEKELNAKDERIRGLMQDLEQMTTKNSQQDLDNQELKTTNQILTDEQQALHLAFASLEEKFRKLQEDNNDLVGRWLQFKSKAADQMNAENDQVIQKRDKVLQKQLADAANEQKLVVEPNQGNDEMALPAFDDEEESNSSEDRSQEELMDTETPDEVLTFDHCYTKDLVLVSNLASGVEPLPEAATIGLPPRIISISALATGVESASGPLSKRMKTMSAPSSCVKSKPALAVEYQGIDSLPALAPHAKSKSAPSKNVRSKPALAASVESVREKSPVVKPITLFQVKREAASVSEGRQEAAPVSGSKQEGARFPELSEEDLQQLARGNLTLRTTVSTRWAVRQFKEWLVERGYSGAFEQLSIEELEPRLRRFYGEVNGKDGKRYCKSSLIGIRAGINRHLQSPPHCRLLNLANDQDFLQANKVLTGRIKLDRAKGLNVTQHRAQITAADVAKLYSSGTLSNDNPQSLQFKVFFELALTFGRKGRHRWCHLKKDNFVFIKTQSTGTEFVMLNEFGDLATNYGRLLNTDSETVRMFSTPGNEKCPVKSLRLYLSKLNKKHDAFFQNMRKGIDINTESEWYVSKMGVNSIKDMMKRMSKVAGLSQQYTNHCLFAHNAAAPAVVIQQ